MKKPELHITKRLGNIPVGGECTSCPDVKFIVASTIPEFEKNLQALEREFAHHFESVHMREDTSQSAARIVREATEQR